MQQVPSPSADTLSVDQTVHQLAAATEVDEPQRAGPPSPLPSPCEPDPLFYVQEDQDEALPLGQEQAAMPLVMPFQPSTPLSSLGPSPQAAAQSAPPPEVAQPRLERPMRRLGLIALLLFVVGASFLGVLLALAHPSEQAPHQQSMTGHSSAAQSGVPAGSTSAPSTPLAAPLPSDMPTPVPTAPPGQAAGLVPPTMLPSTQQLAQLGWSQAGLTQADALEAMRTAQTFVDREMSYDYRTIGTPTQHGGTLTGAVFLLTAGGQVRFVHNDVREINNTLYNTVRDQQRIQQVMESSATITQMQTQTIAGTPQQFAWLDVPFMLWQSRLDAASGQRVGGIEQDATTQQPRVHHMSVLLLRVPPGSQGPAAPMGGTGWLVNVYALDPTTALTVASSPTLE